MSITTKTINSENVNSNVIYSNKITCLSEPINQNDVATKNWVDYNISNINQKSDSNLIELNSLKIEVESLKELKTYITSLKGQIDKLQNFVITNTSSSYSIPEKLSLNYLLN